ncbi:hypothetical protein E2C01_065237 [Portunus trituberculatus]|uniref:Uncharacterized protein n=1 Tax=Portunus trituberculatus TaxID=210409 RepID=A0A5B7HDY8_PORTR|nr:hypothetical protein [Portunus trituberculatus]
MLADDSPPPNLSAKSLRLAALSSILWRRRDSINGRQTCVYMSHLIGSNAEDPNETVS